MFKFMKPKKIILKAPMDGVIVKLEDVPDPAFSQKMIGDGLAIKPTNTTVVSPVDGEVIQVFPTYHALGIKTNGGLEILLHLGIETVNLKGQGFKHYVEKGQKIKVGDKLMEVDWHYVATNAKSIISPIVITNGEHIQKMEILENGEVTKGQDILMIIQNNK